MSNTKDSAVMQGCGKHWCLGRFGGWFVSDINDFGGRFGLGFVFK